MPTSALGENLRIISAYNKELAEKISNIAQLQDNYEIKEAKSGDSILFKNETPVDNPLDPVWDAVEKYNGLEDKTNKNITVIYGFGLGYVLREFAKRHKGKIIVYEPNPEILRITLELADFSEELKNINVRITSDYEEIKKAYLELFFHDYKLNIVPVNYYENLSISETREFKEEMERIHGVYQSNYSNLIKKGHKWTSALFNNIPHIYKNRDLHLLKNRFKGKTAVLISAGPSLDKNIRDLIPYRDKAVIFCVGTALKTALKNGITPDFTVAIEISPNTKKQLDIPEIGDMKVITATNTFRGVFDLEPKCFLNYHLNKDAVTKWFGELMGVPLEEYESAGTVSIIALYSAKMMGMDKIILIGQDLAYTDNKCYSAGSVYGGYSVENSKNIKIDNKDNFIRELETDEKTLTNHIALLGKDLYFIKGANGEKVLSRSDFILFIVYFEEIAQKYAPELCLVNSTEGGAYINGFEHIPLKQALEKYTNGNIDKQIPPLCTKPDAGDVKKRKNTVIKELRDIIKNYYEARDLMENILKTLPLPCLIPETAGRFNAFKDICEKYYEVNYIKSADNIPLTPEEEGLFDIFREKAKEYDDLLRGDIKDLYENHPEKFAQNLTILKDNYFKLKQVLFKNVFFKNAFIGKFLLTDNAVRDFENTGENLLNLYFTLYHECFTQFSVKAGVYIKFIKNILNRLEEQK